MSRALNLLKQTTNLYFDWKNNHSKNPKTIYLLITSKCNSKCIMCNVWNVTSEYPSTVEKELTFNEYSSLFRNLSEMGVQNLWIAGGEPLLREDIVDLLNEAKKNNLDTGITTNGLSMKKELASELIFSGLDILEFSIDAPIPEIHDKIRGVKGGWEKAMHAIKLINEMKKEIGVTKPSIRINYVVCGINYNLVVEMIGLREKLEYDHIDFIPMINKTRRSTRFLLTDEHLKYIYYDLPLIKDKLRENRLPKSILDKFSFLCDNAADTIEGKYGRTLNKKILCLVPYESAIIDPFGKVYPCCFTCSFQNLSEDMDKNFWEKHDFIMGNLRDEPFKKIWGGQKYLKFRKECKNPLNVPMCEWCQINGLNSLLFSALFYDRRLLIELASKIIYRKLS